MKKPKIQICEWEDENYKYKKTIITKGLFVKVSTTKIEVKHKQPINHQLYV